MDMDGKKDIFVANGILKDLTDQDYVSYLADNPDLQSMIDGTKKFDYKEYVNKMSSSPLPDYAFKNEGDGIRYKNMAEAWGLGAPNFSNGSAYGDLDNDGDLDLVVNNNDSPVSIYKNLSVEKFGKKYLRVQLQGDNRNLNAIGAKVYLYQKGATQLLQQMPNRGFQSSVDLTLVFGLDKNPVIDSVVVIWPGLRDGVDKKQVLKAPKANQTLVLSVKNATQPVTVTPAPTSTHHLFTDVTPSSGLSYTHIENEFVDYNRDGLLKQMLSREGPALAVGDVNGDGIDDVFLGGASEMPRSLYFGQPSGQFVLRKQPFLTTGMYTEDVAATFFDADGDKDLDLYVATGGNEFDDVTQLYDRFYRNDGTGNFTWDRSLVRVLENNSCVVAADFDRDGDQDLFLGTRMVPGKYGETPTQTLLVNDGHGTFQKAAPELLPSVRDIGMVTDAVWADIDNDHYPDLVLAGDWMPITVLKNKAGKRFEKVTLDSSSGWWNSIQATDLDKDGDLDFVVGNLGLNSRMVASEQEPAHLYSNDFDRNGSYDQIITCFRPGPDGQSRECPMVQKPDLQKRIPSIKTKFLKHTDYAKASYEDLFTAQQREGTDVKTAVTSETVVLLNDGKGNFTCKLLPMAAQLSPVYASQTGDYNHDGKVDILLAGNFFDVLTEIGRYDASYGLLLTGDGRGNFKPMPAAQSGFFVKGQVRAMQPVRMGAGRIRLVLAKNSDKAQVFDVAEPK